MQLAVNACVAGTRDGSLEEYHQKSDVVTNSCELWAVFLFGFFLRSSCAGDFNRVIYSYLWS